MVHSIGNFTVDLLESTLIDIVHLRALHQPDKTAFRFLADRTDEKTEVTFSELDRNVRNLAAILQKSNLKGERAILLYPSGKDYVTGFLGCLYSGVIAVPAYPPDPTRLNNTLKRLQVIIENSQAKVALTTSHIYSTIKKLLDYKRAESEDPAKENTTKNERQRKEAAELRNLAEKMINSLIWVQTDICETDNENSWIVPAINGDSIAYLQYTSGSTGFPNGVMISHKNILVNSKMIAKAFETSEDHEGVIWLPIYHDMGLIGGVLQPLFAGFTCTLMSPLSFLAWPNRWLKEISNCGDKPVVSGGPNFAYELCTKRVTSEQVANLDLSHWKLAFSGAEPVRWKTIEEFYEKFSPAGFKKESFYPCYGLAEATLLVTGVKRNSSPVYINLNKKALEDNIVQVDPSSLENSGGGTRLVGCGYPRKDGVITIVDPETKHSCSSQQVGEIWFSSNAVAKGYWNKPLETSLTFNQQLDEETEKKNYMRTGDLGFIKDNQLFITGRLKDLIIIRGKNHYPQDIEFTVERSHGTIRQNSTAAFSVEKEDEEALIVVAELATTENNINFNELFSAISNAISTEHDLQVNTIVIIKQKTIFKTSSGKIQRNAVKKAFLEGHLDVINLWQSSI
ncbi:MAG: fatty acyl-AMP ligase, partial [Bacteroidota bacterium]|nr:fatty acyl-AMP ligase [Bacteroidota bacterium]